MGQIGLFSGTVGKWNGGEPMDIDILPFSTPFRLLHTLLHIPKEPKYITPSTNCVSSMSYVQYLTETGNPHYSSFPKVMGEYIFKTYFRELNKWIKRKMLI